MTAVRMGDIGPVRRKVDLEPMPETPAVPERSPEPTETPEPARVPEPTR